RCRVAGITGVSLHSYRHAWAQRAKACGYPQRFAQEALGHNSRAVHEAYAKGALVILPALDQYEQIQRLKSTLCPFREVSPNHLPAAVALPSDHLAISQQAHPVSVFPIPRRACRRNSPCGGSPPATQQTSYPLLLSQETLHRPQRL